MTPDDADRLQRNYILARREWAEDPENGLIPYPKRRKQVKPPPGALDLDAEEEG